MRASRIAIPIAAALALTGCASLLTGLGAVGAAAVIGRDLYCTGVSDAGHQAARDALTDGRQVIACPEYVPAPTAAPEATP